MCYILFCPASIIGSQSLPVLAQTDPNTGLLVTGSVADPVTNDFENGGWLPSSGWVVKSLGSWITDPMSAGLASAIDTLTMNVTGSSILRNDPAWIAMATYFQSYFIKFYASGGIYFAPNNFISDPNLPDSAGLGGCASFEIIPLSGTLDLTRKNELNLIYDPTGSTYDPAALPTFDLEGAPPIMFTITITVP
jgi:hypothetical protein